MLPLVNGKSFLECSEDDLKQIVNNQDFRENEHLEYKKVLSIPYISKKDDRDDAIAELRSDICAFANADGGYLIFGIEEDDGIPKRIEGIRVEDPDKFQLDIGNWINKINPRRPTISFHFVRLENGNYVVIFFVRHDAFFPYVHLENERNYRIYKRYGNSKVVASYADVRNMFTQAVVLEKEIDRFRNERIDYYYSQMDDEGKEYRHFMMLHIFPESFLDNSYNQPLFVLERKQHPFSLIFRHISCYDGSVPMVEGLRFPGNSGETEGRLLNNGIAEFFYSLSSYLHRVSSYPEKVFFPWKNVWDIIESSIRDYLSQLQGLFQVGNLYVGFTVIGCKNVISDNSTPGMNAIIDRDKLIMNTIVIDCDDEESLSLGIKRMKLDFLLSLGVKYNKEINELISEIHEG